jgi:peptide/nickel transport system ATP-binding protein
MNRQPLLAVEDLVVDFRQRGWRKTPVRAVDGVSFTIGAGETVGLVGESGSGKSTIGRAVLGLLEPTGGRIAFDGVDVTNRTAKQRRELARSMSAVFQDPYSSLNPSLTVGSSILEPVQVQGRLDAESERARVRELLEAVRLRPGVAGRYPHSFSGGQRQRIAIARALSTGPRLVICDEAVSALDAITRGQIMNLLVELQEQTQVGLLFIAHDLPIVAHHASRIIVLYRGRIMEEGATEGVIDHPLHPYTRALLAAVPVVDPKQQTARRAARAATVSTSTANAAQPPAAGCVFAPRCPHAAQVCWERRPVDARVAGRAVECHLYDPASGHPEAAPAATAVSA